MWDLFFLVGGCLSHGSVPTQQVPSPLLQITECHWFQEYGFLPTQNLEDLTELDICFKETCFIYIKVAIKCFFTNCVKSFYDLVLLLSEIFELEVNENVQLAVNDRQMPKVEYMEIKIDDYSK